MRRRPPPSFSTPSDRLAPGGSRDARGELPQRSAGVVPIRRTAAGARVLVLRAWRHWDFPKGRIEPGETPLAAALRESREEAALDDLVFPWGEVYRDTSPYAGGKVSRYFVGETQREDVVLPINPELGRAEHHEGRWLEIPAARALLVPRLQTILDWARGVVARR
jgi:bis(5'-nucleosidyl)-tetraphosphatase